jgi:hypothetical protein
MTYAAISIDRRESYYARAAKLIAANPLAFYTRAEAGRRIQAAIKPTDYATPKPVPKASNVLEITARKGARRGM